MIDQLTFVGAAGSAAGAGLTEFLPMRTDIASTLLEQLAEQREKTKA